MNSVRGAPLAPANSYKYSKALNMPAWLPWGTSTDSFLRFFNVIQFVPPRGHLQSLSVIGSLTSENIKIFVP